MRRLGIVAVSIGVLVSGLTACVPPPDDGGGTTTTVPASCDRIVRQPISDGAGRAASVSADGRRVAYLVGDTVRLVDLDTGSDDELAQLPAGHVYGKLQMSTDGERVGVRGNEQSTGARKAWIVEVSSGVATELDWSGIDWPNWTFESGFSADLSVYVTIWYPNDQVRIIPSDGSPVRHVPMPVSSVLIDADGSTLVGRDVAWHDGALVELPLDVGSWGGVTDLSRDGTRALVDTTEELYIWRLDTGEVDLFTLPVGEPAVGYSAHLTDDGRVYIGGAVIDGIEDVWRVDLATGAATRLPDHDGITSLSDDGRVMTSTISDFLRCEG